MEWGKREKIKVGGGEFERKMKTWVCVYSVRRLLFLTRVCALTSAAPPSLSFLFSCVASSSSLPLSPDKLPLHSLFSSQRYLTNCLFNYSTTSTIEKINVLYSTVLLRWLGHTERLTFTQIIASTTWSPPPSSLGVLGFVRPNVFWWGWNLIMQQRVRW